MRSTAKANGLGKYLCWRLGTKIIVVTKENKAEMIAVLGLDFVTVWSAAP